MAGGPLPHLHPLREPKRPIRWPMRKTSGLCPKLGSKWNSSWVVAQLAIVGPGLCSTWRRPPTPGCRTLCPLTWTSGGRSSSWPESLIAPSCLGRNDARAGPSPASWWTTPTPHQERTTEPYLATEAGRPSP